MRFAIVAFSSLAFVSLVALSESARHANDDGSTSFTSFNVFAKPKEDLDTVFVPNRAEISFTITIDSIAYEGFICVCYQTDEAGIDSPYCGTNGFICMDALEKTVFGRGSGQSEDLTMLHYKAAQPPLVVTFRVEIANVHTQAHFSIADETYSLSCHRWKIVHDAHKNLNETKLSLISTNQKIKAEMLLPGVIIDEHNPLMKKITVDLNKKNESEDALGKSGLGSNETANANLTQTYAVTKPAEGGGGNTVWLVLAIIVVVLLCSIVPIVLVILRFVQGVWLFGLFERKVEEVEVEGGRRMKRKGNKGARVFRHEIAPDSFIGQPKSEVDSQQDTPLISLNEMALQLETDTAEPPSSDSKTSHPSTNQTSVVSTSEAADELRSAREKSETEDKQGKRKGLFGFLNSGKKRSSKKKGRMKQNTKKTDLPYTAENVRKELNASRKSELKRLSTHTNLDSFIPLPPKGTANTLVTAQDRTGNTDMKTGQERTRDAQLDQKNEKHVTKTSVDTGKERTNGGTKATQFGSEIDDGENQQGGQAKTKTRHGTQHTQDQTQQKTRTTVGTQDTRVDEDKGRGKTKTKGVTRTQGNEHDEDEESKKNTQAGRGKTGNTQNRSVDSDLDDKPTQGGTTAEQTRGTQSRTKKKATKRTTTTVTNTQMTKGTKDSSGTQHGTDDGGETGPTTTTNTQYQTITRSQKGRSRSKSKDKTAKVTQAASSGEQSSTDDAGAPARVKIGQTQGSKGSKSKGTVSKETQASDGTKTKQTHGSKDRTKAGPTQGSKGSRSRETKPSKQTQDESVGDSGADN